MKWKLAALFLTVCVLFSFCGNAALAEGEVKEIVVWKRTFETWNQQFFADCVAEYNRLNPDVNITIEFVAEGGFDELMAASMAVGAAPDIYDDNHNYINAAAARGEILPLSDYMTHDAVSDVLDNVAKVLRHDGKLYGYPQFIELNNVLFYNTEMFAAAGIENAPKTWAEWLDAARRLTTDDVFGLQLPSWGMMHWTTWAWQIGEGHLALTDNWDAPAIDDFKDMLNFFGEAYATEVVPPEMLAKFTNISPFANGQVAMTLTGSYNIGAIFNDFPEMADKFAIAPMPTKDGDPSRATALYGGYSFVVDATSKYPAECAAFLEWMLADAERMSVFYEYAQYGKFPATRKGSDLLNATQADNPYVEILSGIAATAVSEPLYPWSISQTVGVMFENVASGVMTADEAIADAKVKIQSIIDSQKLAGTNPFNAE